jgi:two-component system LytT family response regulator
MTDHKIRAIIVDDEKNGRENLKGALQSYCPEIEITGEADSALAAIELIEKVKPTLVFLDIEMPNGNGFQILEFFTKPNFQVIFVTAYDQYAIKAIRFSALDYILKPIDIMLLKAAIDRHHDFRDTDKRLQQFISNKQLPTKSKRIALPLADKIHFIEVQDIVSCKGEGSYTTIYKIGGEKLMVSKPLIDYEELLETFGFIRTHKSHIVNRSHISTFVKSDGGYLLMSDGSNIPVSSRKKEEVLLELKS